MLFCNFKLLMHKTKLLLTFISRTFIVEPITPADLRHKVCRYSFFLAFYTFLCKVLIKRVNVEGQGWVEGALKL